MSRATFGASGHTAPESPLLITDAIAQWFRLTTATNNGANKPFTVQDLTNSGQAMNTSVENFKPSITTGSKGLTALRFVDDVLAIPLCSANNDTTKFGIAFWIDIQVIDATARRIIGDPSPSPLKLRFVLDNNAARGLYADIYSGSSFRRASSGNSLTTGKHFLTLEIDCSQGTEATQCLITVDTVIKTLTFLNLGGLNSFPVSLNTAISPYSFGASAVASNATPIIGDFYENIFILNRQLTPTERTNLMNYRSPL